jgi:hypothetical protein
MRSRRRSSVWPALLGLAQVVLLAFVRRWIRLYGLRFAWVLFRKARARVAGRRGRQDVIGAD